MIAQLERFVHEVLPENRELHKDKILAFLKRKIVQYETLLEKLVESTDHPDITEKTLLEYRIRAFKLLSSFKKCYLCYDNKQAVTSFAGDIRNRFKHLLKISAAHDL